MKKMMFLLLTAIYLSPLMAASSSSTEPSAQAMMQQSQDALWPEHIQKTFSFLEKLQDDSQLGQQIRSFSEAFAEKVQDRETLKQFNANRLLTTLQQFAKKIWTQRGNLFLELTKLNKETGQNYNLEKFNEPWKSIKQAIKLIENEVNLDMLFNHLETLFINIHAFDAQLVDFNEALTTPRVIASSSRQRKFPSTKAPTPPTTKQVATTQTRKFLPRPTRDAPKPPVITRPKPVLKAPIAPQKPAHLAERMGPSTPPSTQTRQLPPPPIARDKPAVIQTRQLPPPPIARDKPAVIQTRQLPPPPIARDKPAVIQTRQLPPPPIARDKPAVIQTRQLPPPPIARDKPAVIQTRQLPPPPIARDKPAVIQTRQLPPPPIARDKPAVIQEKIIPKRLQTIRRLASKGRRPSNVRAALARGTTTYTEPEKKENPQPQQQPGRMGFGMIDLGSVQLKKRTQ